MRVELPKKSQALPKGHSNFPNALYEAIDKVEVTGAGDRCPAAASPGQARADPADMRQMKR